MTAVDIVVPMAGLGSRFRDVGFDAPKPLIRVGGLPMIARVIDNCRPREAHRFIFIVLEEHMREYSVDDTLRRFAGNCEVVSVPEVTGGAAMTVLAARDVIEAGRPIVIVNSDQIVLPDLRGFFSEALSDDLDGTILTMGATDPKWSFVALDEQGHVTRVAEKEPISDVATVGIYHFRDGSEFIAGADAMVGDGETVNGEYYVAPVYNRLIAGGAKIGIVDAGPEGEAVWGIGTPHDLYRFMEYAPMGQSWT